MSSVRTFTTMIRSWRNQNSEKHWLHKGAKNIQTPWGHHVYPSSKTIRENFIAWRGVKDLHGEIALPAGSVLLVTLLIPNRAIWLAQRSFMERGILWLLRENSRTAKCLCLYYVQSKCRTFAKIGSSWHSLFTWSKSNNANFQTGFPCRTET